MPRCEIVPAPTTPMRTASGINNLPGNACKFLYQGNVVMHRSACIIAQGNRSAKSPGESGFSDVGTAPVLVRHLPRKVALLVERKYVPPGATQRKSGRHAELADGPRPLGPVGTVY